MTTSSEDSLRFSDQHNITTSVEGKSVNTRQINNGLVLPDDQQDHLLDFATSNSYEHFNIPPESIPILSAKELKPEDVVVNPVPAIFISSFGLLNDSEWTSSQPSEGTAVLSEWLARNEPHAAPIFVDPNLIDGDELETVLHNFTRIGRQALVGFSLLPVNLRNDAQLVSKIKSILPESVMIAGGIGSEVLDLLPTKTGGKGITEVLPIDKVLTGSSFSHLSRIIRQIYSGSFSEDIQPEDCDDHSGFFEVQTAREMARRYFIPYEKPDIVHGVSYKQANQSSTASESADIVSVLIDNQCSQGCYFCASPKQQLYADLEEAVDHVQQKTEGASVIAFNDNDLSNDVQQTMALCRLIVDRKIMQPKHGKMRCSQYESDLIDSLAKAGFVRIALGIESFDQKVRSKLNKRNFVDETITANLEHMLGVGIKPEINLILFTPHESEDSLKRTVGQALYWVARGCSLYVTMGLFATPNSPGVKRLLSKGKLLDSQAVEVAEIASPDTEDSLLFPTQWKTSPELVALKEELLSARQEVLRKLSGRFNVDMSVPIEAYVGIALLANHFGIKGFKNEEDLMSVVFEYAANEVNEQYVSI